MPESVLYIVPEDPEVEHVAAQVQPAAVHEHGGEHGYEIAARVLRQAAWDDGPLLYEGLAAI
ncbi:MAG TPA: hypothetical protein VIG25_10880 [Pyrinomonadaceae bacterium]